MNKIKNKNKSISKINRYNSEKNNEKDNLIKTIISNKGYKCIGPCYPPNTIFYNPLGLIPTLSSEPTCPIKKSFDNEYGKFIYADKCNIEDINYNYNNLDIFDESVKIALTSDLFLKQIYNIKNISDVVIFLNDTINNLPIYSQKRILNCIIKTYKNINEFPFKIIIEKINIILKHINKFTIPTNKIYDEIILFNKNNNEDIFNYLTNKYSK